MKIRPDFVTNSSSGSYGEVIIDNPVLLEILAKYKAMGNFRGIESFEIGDFQSCLMEDDMDSDIKTLTPAFHSISCEGWGSWEFAPSSLDEVLENIIEVMDHELENIQSYDPEVFLKFFDQELYQKLREELRQSADEINNSFIAVKWFSREDLYDGRFRCWEFKYDREHGEDYYEEETGNMDW